MSEGERGQMMDCSVWRAVKARWEADLELKEDGVVYPEKKEPALYVRFQGLKM